MTPHAATQQDLDAARSGAALVERPRAGLVILAGRDRVKHLHRLSTNEVRKLEPPAGTTAVLTTHKGRIFDLVHVACLPDQLWLSTSDDRGAAVKDWLEGFVVREKVMVEDRSADSFHALVLGPRAPAIVATLGLEVGSLPPWHHARSDDGSIAYRGELYLDHPCVHVIGPDARRGEIVTRLRDAGAAPISIDGYEAIRIESGIPAHPGELSDERNPWEARLDGSISLLKGCYIGQEVVARLDTYKKVHRALARFELARDAPLPAADRIELSVAGRKAGYVSGLAALPGSELLVGIGYVAGDLVDGDAELGYDGGVVRARPIQPWQKAEGA